MIYKINYGVMTKIYGTDFRCKLHSRKFVNFISSHACHKNHFLCHNHQHIQIHFQNSYDDEFLNGFTAFPSSFKNFQMMRFFLCI